MIRVAIACFCAAFCVAAIGQVRVMTQRDVFDRIESHWKKAYPEEKIVSIDEVRSIQSSSMGRHGSIEVKQAIVSVRRPGLRPLRFRTTIHYRSRNNIDWQFEHVWVDRPAP